MTVNFLKYLVNFVFVVGLLPIGMASNIKKDNSRISVVVIDPGHGGRDPGAIIGNAREKDIVLEIALKLGQKIKNAYPDVEVIFTRNADIFIPLHKRAAIANQNEADLFISIHANAVDIKSVHGAETFVLGLHSNQENLEVAQKENAAILLEDNYQETYADFDPNSDESYIMFANMQEEFQNQSVQMAAFIQDEFRTYAKRSDRSVKMAGFLVLRQTSMPSVLIETGFLSHSKERNYLLSDSGRDAIATSIYRAFRNYKTEIEDRSTFTVVSEENNSVQSSASSTPASSHEEAYTRQTHKKKSSPLEEHRNIYYSVQIMALTKKLEPNSDHFKNEKEIFRVDDKTISRYFSGRFKTYENAMIEQDRIRTKFENAFVVAFENNKLISVKKALQQK